MRENKKSVKYKDEMILLVTDLLGTVAKGLERRTN